MWKCGSCATLMAGLAAVMTGVGGACAETQESLAKPGNTAVLKWSGGKKAVFLLAFDDSCQSHVQNVIPELKKRGMVGTFYINPANGPFKGAKAVWEKELPTNPAVEFGNHTLSHAGATNAVQLDVELARCGEVIRACYPDRKWPRLVSFGRPGGVPWKVSDEEQRQALAKYNLIERPPFFGYAIHVKTTEEACKLVDQAIAMGEMGHLDFHGVGGDWLVTPLDVFTALLDKLDACKADIWVTDHISYHKYLTERATANVSVVQSDGEQIRLQLSSAADPAFYDAALTLETRVPPEWTGCQVIQGEARSEAQPIQGVVRYAVVPGKDEIVLKKR